MMLSQERLKELLNYDHETGVFTHIKARPAVRVGSIAGTVVNKGYVRINIDGKIYLAHRLAWLYVNGDFPPKQIDHINRVRTDNRICNLRMATNSENQQNRSMQYNNTSGHVGVHWSKASKKWHARIKINSKFMHLGLFSDLSEAVAARKAAEVKYHTFNQLGE